MSKLLDYSSDNYQSLSTPSEFNKWKKKIIGQDQRGGGDDEIFSNILLSENIGSTVDSEVKILLEEAERRKNTQYGGSRKKRRSKKGSKKSKKDLKNHLKNHQIEHLQNHQREHLKKDLKNHQKKHLEKNLIIKVLNKNPGKNQERELTTVLERAFKKVLERALKKVLEKALKKVLDKALKKVLEKNQENNLVLVRES